MENITTLNFMYNIPDLIEDKIETSDVYRTYNSQGDPTNFVVDLEFDELNLSKTLKSREFHALKGKIEETLYAWESKYKRYIDKKHKEQTTSNIDKLNKDAKEDFENLDNILAHALSIDNAVNWDDKKRKEPFKIRPKELFSNKNFPDYLVFNSFGKPTTFGMISEPSKPVFEEVKNEYGLFSKIFRSNAIREDYESRVRQKIQIAKDNETRKKFFKQAVKKFEVKKKEFEDEKKAHNEAIDNAKLRYSQKNPKSIEEYCNTVLNNSEYPNYFPKKWQLAYKEDSKMIVVEYHLPSPEQLPTIESYRYIKSRDEVSTKAISLTKRKKIYESLIYQICIRTIHELFEADVVNALDSVAFNGLVTNTNPATGIEETKIIMTIIANKDQFTSLNLFHVDPKATFKFMKGISATSLIDLTPIPPVIQLEKSDKRFIGSKNIVENIDDSVNLAAMHWDDFEHLVRELFEKEFASNGGEVKVTQGSSDGGVDAIAFDPDPIRGGKIIIQAKRYTNVVGVAAVRDLYGTVMNEGATKGILVTTSDYGRDSYEFAKDKPLTLLNGSNLLSLMEKHGHKARINITEAKKILNTSN